MQFVFVFWYSMRHNELHKEWEEKEKKTEGKDERN